MSENSSLGLRERATKLLLAIIKPNSSNSSMNQTCKNLIRLERADYNVVGCGDQTDEENSEQLLVRILNASSSDANSRSKDVFESDVSNLILLVKFAK